MWLLLDTNKEDTDDDRRMRAKLFELCPPLAKVSEATRAFQSIFREKAVERLPAWMKTAATLGRELASFAHGLKLDLAAVEQAVVSEWSQGQTEGQVNRLKMLKRQMFGRAGFDLLRRRVLFASAA